MKSSTAFKRILSQSKKQIKRSGWLSVASVLVMSLAMFISSIFILLAFVSNLFLQSIENEPHIYAFFKVGTEETEILDIQEKWLQQESIEFIDYTSEEDAIKEFKTAEEISNPQIANNVRENVLPPSLSIRLYKIQDADQIIDLVISEQENNPDITTIAFNKNTIETIKSLFYWLRIGGGVMMGLLLIVILTFTLLTIEFRTYSRAEEIGIMQLVGGSLWFIRAPFIFEGAFYGLLGSFIATTTLYILTYVIFVLNKESGAVTFLINFFSDLRWPHFELYHYILIFVALLIIGMLIGIINSFIAIKKYIT